jgi:hypothetical protein
MKALKEKRIGLRSLWRRGLVILSLFALVFASCNTSDDGDTSSSVVSGKTILEFRIRTQPTARNYEGMQVDIGGIVIEARYADDWQTFKTVPMSDHSKFGVWPKYVQNSSYTANGGQYFLYTIQDGTQLYAIITITANNLMRSNTLTTGAPSTNPHTPSTGSGGTIQGDNPNYYADGLQLHLDLDRYKKEYFVDDYPDFTGITLQGHYVNNDYKDIPLDHDMRWEIRPNYANNNNTGPGVLAITVGGVGDSLYRPPVTSGPMTPPWPGDSGYAPPTETDGNKGVTVFVPLEKVYQVNKIELSKKPARTGLIYFERERGPNDWLSADGRSGYASDAEITVTYSNGAPNTKTFDMVQAARQNTVWYNLNPIDNKTPITVRGIESTVKDLQGATTAWPSHKKPQITFYYRGYTVACDMPIFNKFDRIEVTPASGVTFPIDADMTGTDNDLRRFDENQFRQKLVVTAYFKASTAPDLERPLVLSYQSAWDTDVATTLSVNKLGKPLAGQNDWVAANYGSGSGFTGGPTVYTLDFGTPDWNFVAAPSNATTDQDRYELGPNAWGVSANPRNNGKTAKVTVSYTPGVGYAYPFEASAAPSAKRQTVDVNWTGIPPAAP